MGVDCDVPGCKIVHNPTRNEVTLLKALEEVIRLHAHGRNMVQDFNAAASIARSALASARGEGV